MYFLIITNLNRFANDPETRVVLSPKPKKVNIFDFSYEMTPETVVIAADSKEMRDVIDCFVEFFVEDWGMDPPFRVFLKAEDKIDEFENIEFLRDHFNKAAITHEQGYTINSTEDSVIIIGNKPVGVYYGLMTFLQAVIISKEKILRFPAMEVCDFPDMDIRGLSDELSRGQVGNVESFKRNIRLYSKFKLNQYLLYIEDVFAFESFPCIGKERGALTADEIEEVQKYAEKHFVDIIPIFQTLGHWENFFWTPELTEYGEFPGGNSLDMSNQKTYELLEKLLKEISGVFKSKYFHIGCDESWHVGLGKAREYIKEKGLGNAYSKHYNWVISKLKEFGKEKIYLYHDIASRYKEVNENLPKDDLIYVFWKYNEQETYPELQPIVDAKIPFVVSSSVLNWCKIYPDIDGAERTNLALIKYGFKQGAKGQIVSSWGDNGNENFRENNHFGFCNASAISWNIEGFDSEEFVMAFCNCAYGHYTPELIELYTLIKSAPKVMESEIFNNFYAYFWRHPFPCRDFDKSISPHDQWYSSDYKEDFESHFLRIKQICQDLPDKIFRNYIFIDYIEYFADAVLTLIKKIQYTYKISYICTEDLNAEKVTEIDKYLHVLRDMYEDLREKYEQLWLYSAKRPRLDNVLRYFDWMIYWLDSKHEEVEMGQQWKYPFILSDWIYAKEDEEDQTSEIRYFVKQFEMTQEKIDDLEEAWVQAIPSSYCEVYINGKLVISVPRNEGTTLILMDSQVKIKEITSLLTPGLNTIAVNAQMLPKGIPTFNLFMEFTFKSSLPDIIISDLTWKTTMKKVKEWPKPTEIRKEDGWKRVRSYGKPPVYSGEITYPCFKRRFPSKITHGGFMVVPSFIVRNAVQKIFFVAVKMQADNPNNKM